MAGYTSGFSSGPGDKIDAILFDNEYANLETAFNNTSGHNHSGPANEGGFIPLISDQNTINSVVVDPANKIIFNVADTTATSRPSLEVKFGNILPFDQPELNSSGVLIDIGVNLGSDIRPFNDISINGTGNLSALKLGVLSNSARVGVTSILDDDTMSADRNDALVTQQSIKAYVDTGILNSPGIFTQSVTNSFTNQIINLSPGFSNMLSQIITVTPGSKVHIQCFAEAAGASAGGVIAAIYRDNVLVSNTSEFVVSASTSNAFSGSTGFTFIDTATASTHEYQVMMKRVDPGVGYVTQISIILLEETV